jgi:hypothetical protein
MLIGTSSPDADAVNVGVFVLREVLRAAFRIAVGARTTILRLQDERMISQMLPGCVQGVNWV